MRTPELLRRLADSTSQKKIACRLLEAADLLEDQRLWREAWLRAESKVDQLTRELELVRSRLHNRKEKERED